MSRSIKFKGWVANKKSMSPGGFTIDEFQTLAVEMGGAILEKDGIIWLQFTGLLDSEGKEMYEGDIVNAKFQNEFGSVNNDYGFVEFHPILAQFILRSIKDPSYYSLLAQEGKVVGNIYENPEMLKV
jgi:uncharacterized phage protein (TIGR01671 family)